MAGIGEGQVTEIDQQLLQLLVCPVPKCRGKLEPAADGLTCAACGLHYDISDGWPNLIPEDATPTADQKAKPQS